MKIYQRSFAVFLAVAALVSASLKPLHALAAEKKITVTTTTSMVTDLVRQIGGDRVEVQGLMGAGVDPHLYKATSSDLSKLQRGKIIFYSGLMLEGKMQDLFVKLASAKRPVLAVTDSIPKEKLLKPAQFEGHFDPHVWFEVPLWSKCGETVLKGLAQIDPAGKEYYTARHTQFVERMKNLHAWSLKKSEELPNPKRILVTSHDAYNYFGRAYDFKVVGLQGISTVTEASLADFTGLVDFIKKNSIKAIFVESSVPHTTIERISKDAGVKVGGELFSDAMGTPGQMENGYDLGTYEGMIKHNMTTIVDSLKKR